ncbi:hypothetical protein Bcav_1035 [Beutenbergia cavernae DSM 12333]|uniref:Uncharacterized protein n=1 Tax=Beutenbergia cavernae (strain ATCC BAA-8 / DSM 12333 / CCUG 43141 / JCM 11478 / NBRC 16432 / NCIMB 13614 / HKI 0122) TaxID=471853 RepID=C5C0B0_BEUC1|nr:hypothetical protein [Beutenbergia cavernae]ACQ79296.1 hypothetical protein Bcav_1035 [Beutenbergia cavernae DSM 12333]
MTIPENRPEIRYDPDLLRVWCLGSDEQWHLTWDGSAYLVVARWVTAGAIGLGSALAL